MHGTALRAVLTGAGAPVVGDRCNIIELMVSIRELCITVDHVSGTTLEAGAPGLPLSYAVALAWLEVAVSRRIAVLPVVVLLLVLGILRSMWHVMLSSVQSLYGYTLRRKPHVLAVGPCIRHSTRGMTQGAVAAVSIGLLIGSNLAVLVGDVLVAPGLCLPVCVAGSGAVQVVLLVLLLVVPV